MQLRLPALVLVVLMGLLSGCGGDVVDTVDITVNAVNDDPANTVPAAHRARE